MTGRVDTGQGRPGRVQDGRPGGRIQTLLVVAVLATALAGAVGVALFALPMLAGSPPNGGAGAPAPSGSFSSAVGPSPAATLAGATPAAVIAPGAACATPAPSASFAVCAGSAASSGPTVSSGPVGSPAPVASVGPGGFPVAPATTDRPSAPTSAAGFRVRDTIVSMGFPLPATAAYRYGDGWRAPRVGVVLPYNQVRGVAPNGTYLRAHDGLDLQVRNGTPVLAPFAGIVIDPATRWRPWVVSRYGRVVAIESDEPTSTGYVVILAHLSRVGVHVGDHVERGEPVGRTGQTGDAAGTRPHLHFELHAPFRIRYTYAGVVRRLDVFDAGPSVRAADPKRH